MNFMRMISGRPIVTKEHVWNPYTHLHFPTIKDSFNLINNNFELLGYKGYISERNSFWDKYFSWVLKISLRLFARGVIYDCKIRKN